MLEAVDEERLALGRAFDLDLVPEPEMSRRQGYCEHADYLRGYRDGSVFQNLKGPDSMNFRYITEDIPCALVTFLQLAQVCGLDMPVSEALARLGSVVSGRDFLARPTRGLDELGLAGMSRDQIITYVQEGLRG